MSKPKKATKVDFIKEYLTDYVAFRLRHDLITDKLQIFDENQSWRELTKKDINTIVCECATLSGMNITDREVRCVLNSDFVPSVHPLRDYIDSLIPFDPDFGVDWIDKLAAQVHVTSDQTRWQKVFKKWFVAMVASWLDDNIVNQHVLVLIGKQGIYKTTWLEHLLPPELRAYGSKLTNLHDLSKDDRLRLAECALINIDEMDALTNRELNQMKSVITSADVNERAAYAYSKERRFRLASFCASGNKREFLTDTTGNRRWLPFEVESIDSPFDNAVQPYKFYYAQAKYLIEQGFNYWFDTNDVRALEQHTDSFRNITPEEQLLPIYYTPTTLDDTNAVFRTTAEIAANLAWRGNIRNPMGLAALGRILAAKGFTQRRLPHGGARGYVVIEHQRNIVEDQQKIQQLKDEEYANSVPEVPEVPAVF